MTSNCRNCVAVAIVLLGTVAVPAYAQDAAKGAVLMAAARQAVGGATRLTAVKTLQVTGTFRRVIAGSDSDGDIEVFLELPDKYLRSEKTGTPGQPSIETIEALVATAVRDVVRGGGRGGAGGGRGGGGGGGGGGDAAPPEDAAVDRGDGLGALDARDRQGDGQGGGQGAGENVGTAAGRGGSGVDPDTARRARQAEVGRLWLMWLLKADEPVTWIGIAESPDGKADVLETRFAGELTRLFLDAVSHMPLMMTWQAVAGGAGGRGGRRGGRGSGGGGSGAAGGDGGGGGGGGRRGAVPDSAGPRQGGPPQPMTFEMTFGDHRAVNGMKLPHVVTRGIDGKTIEQWTIRSYRVNPSFNAETFTR